MKRIISILIVTFFFLSTYSQNTLQGRIEDLRKQGIPYTTIKLLQVNDSSFVKGLVSDSFDLY